MPRAAEHAEKWYPRKERQLGQGLRLFLSQNPHKTSCSYTSTNWYFKCMVKKFLFILCSMITVWNRPTIPEQLLTFESSHHYLKSNIDSCRQTAEGRQQWESLGGLKRNVADEFWIKWLNEMQRQAFYSRNKLSQSRVKITRKWTITQVAFMDRNFRIH